MKHLEEEQLVMHFYGEAERPQQVERHLQDCSECRERLSQIKAALAEVDALPIPERGPEYGREVYERLAPRLPGSGGWLSRILAWAPPAWAWAPLAAGLIILAFLAGRYWQPVPPAQQAASPAAEVRERVLLLAVGEHLERAEALLIELGNASGEENLDLSYEREVAEEMARSGRLYREAALQSGDPGLAEVLELLRRFLLDVANSPRTISAQELRSLQERMEAAGLTFKVRVIKTRVNEEQLDHARRLAGS